MNQIATILRRRDGLSVEEAQETVKEMRERVRQGEDPEELLYELGLEPDYLWELI